MTLDADCERARRRCSTAACAPRSSTRSARCVISRETPDAFLIAASGGAADDRPRPCLRRRPARREPRRRARRVRPGARRASAARADRLPRPAAVPARTPAAAAPGWHVRWPTSTSGSARSPASRTRTSSRRRSASTRRRGPESVAGAPRSRRPTGDTCDSPSSAAGDALTAPSAGRLTTAAVGVPGEHRPCTIPPFGGYRGTENRLYRVEIHDAGPLGTATFKWSRDNASIAATCRPSTRARTTLTRRAASAATASSGSRVDDWVEVTDDWHELHGLPGELRKVSDRRRGPRRITVGDRLTAGAFDATDPTRHTRVIRWDEAGPRSTRPVASSPVPAAAGTPIVLEDGVQISFDADPAGGDLPRRRLLGVRRPHGRRLGRAARGGAAARRPRTTTAAWASSPSPDGRSTAAAAARATTARLRLRVRRLRHAGVARERRADDPDAVDQGRGDGRQGLPAGRPLPPGGAGDDRRRPSMQIEGKGWKTIVLAGAAAPAFIVERSIGVTIDCCDRDHAAPCRAAARSARASRSSCATRSARSSSAASCSSSVSSGRPAGRAAGRPARAIPGSRIPARPKTSSASRPRRG